MKAKPTHKNTGMDSKSKKDTPVSPIESTNYQNNFAAPSRPANPATAVNFDKDIIVKIQHEPEPQITYPSTQPQTKSHSSDTVSNPTLRKKICQKLVKYLEEKYDLKQEVAREKTMVIENKIRLTSPEMKEVYKDRCLIILRLIRVFLFQTFICLTEFPFLRLVFLL